MTFPGGLGENGWVGGWVMRPLVTFVGVWAFPGAAIAKREAEANSGPGDGDCGEIMAYGR